MWLFLLVFALLMILVNPAASALGFGVSVLMFCCAFEGKQYIDRKDRDKAKGPLPPSFLWHDNWCLPYP